LKAADSGVKTTGSFWQRLKSWVGQRWPEGTPLISGGVRWGTRLEDGKIVGAPGTHFTPLPICSRCQQDGTTAKLIRSKVLPREQGALDRTDQIQDQ
jgi:hypothetical protein